MWIIELLLISTALGMGLGIGFAFYEKLFKK